MATSQHNVDHTTNNDEDVSQPMMKIQTTNLYLVPSLDQYLEELRMCVQILNYFVLSTTLSSSFAIPMTWLSLDATTVVFNKSTKVVTFQLSNSKTNKLTRNQFSQMLQLPVFDTFYEVTNDQVVHMFNEMGHQPTLNGIIYFKKSGLSCVWSFLFGIML
ncbi:unnamed protein product [Lactuca saligna]|uniref:Uncharacterized protein n=1 Tax=Lactuca saligna TaxID=75948 RepID=A0AA35ZVV2_LACSI|nr:unnamed protein product [Lactuca saligna]